MRSNREDRKLKGLPTRVGRRIRGQKIDKYGRYRLRVGKPLGPGVPGNKKGKGRLGGPSSIFGAWP